MVKTAEELERLKEVARLTDKSIEAALNIAREGGSERDTVHELLSCGIGSDAFPIFAWVSFGSKTQFNVTCNASDYEPRPGDFLKIDAGFKYRGYASDVARTFVFRTPTPKQNKYLRAIFDGVESTIDVIKPGIRICDVYKAFEDKIRVETPKIKLTNIGHNIGIDMHEYPMILPTEETLLEPNVVLSIEVPWQEIGWGGIIEEDTVVVTQKGCEPITRHSEQFTL
jgi:Xaa-Pro aminopeptidase